MNVKPSESTTTTPPVALVTGSSRGLGQHFACVLAESGHRVVLTSRKLQDLAETEQRIDSIGGESFSIALDVRHLESIHDAIPTAINHWGRIDVLVNNAGCNIRKPSLDVTWDDWNTIIDTNLRGSFFVAQAVVRHAMLPQQFGRIINIGSVTSVFGYAGLAPYGASRGGTRQLTMSLADEWGADGITVNCLAPGWFETAQNRIMYQNAEWVEYLSERIPMGRPGQFADLDAALLFLAARENGYYTGQTLLIDGGITVGRTRALPNQGSGSASRRAAPMESDSRTT